MFPETWLPHAKNPRFIELQGEKDAVVDTRELAGKGYLWQCRKKYGYAKTLEEAKAWVEGLATHYSIESSKRWMTI